MQKILYIFVIILVASCTSNTIFKKPDDLIGKEEMVNLLTDMYLATAAKNTKNLNNKRNVDYTYLVFEKYGIDSGRFKRSNFYYTTKIDEYEVIYSGVEANIKALNESYKFIKREKDSILKDSLAVVRKIKDSIVKLQIRKDSIAFNTIKPHFTKKDSMHNDSLMVEYRKRYAKNLTEDEIEEIKSKD